MGEPLGPKRLQSVVVAPSIVGDAEDRAVAAIGAARVAAELADRDESGSGVRVEQVGIDFVEANACEVCAGIGRGDSRSDRKLSASFGSPNCLAALMA